MKAQRSLGRETSRAFLLGISSLPGAKFIRLPDNNNRQGCRSFPEKRKVSAAAGLPPSRRLGCGKAEGKGPLAPACRSRNQPDYGPDQGARIVSPATG